MMILITKNRTLCASTAM